MAKKEYPKVISSAFLQNKMEQKTFNKIMTGIVTALVIGGITYAIYFDKKREEDIEKKLHNYTKVEEVTASEDRDGYSTITERYYKKINFKDERVSFQRLYDHVSELNGNKMIHKWDRVLIPIYPSQNLEDKIKNDNKKSEKTDNRIQDYVKK